MFIVVYFILGRLNLSQTLRKPVFMVSDKVKYEQCRATTKDGKMFENDVLGKIHVPKIKDIIRGNI